MYMLRTLVCILILINLNKDLGLFCIYVAFVLAFAKIRTKLKAHGAQELTRRQKGKQRSSILLV
jgi:hypothetical protein